jgi:hypothetical protein
MKIEMKILPEIKTNVDLIEVSRFSDGSASDAWKPTKNAKSKPIESDKVLSVKCNIEWKDQGWGNKKGQVKVALIREGTEIASENLFP